MRLTILSLVAILVPAVPSSAQDGIPGVPGPHDPPPRFSVARPVGTLPSIGLPLPQHGVLPPSRSGERPRRQRERAFFPHPMMVFYLPQFIAWPAPVSPPPPEPEKPPAPGRLVLDVEPATAQVFADGYYIGVPDDFSAERGGAPLEAGPHRIDVSAVGYESIAVDLRVSPGQPVTYRAALKALPPPAEGPKTTFYLIPGCYMGNIPPKDADLPATCDQGRAIAWVP